jgi:adenylate kinase
MNRYICYLLIGSPGAGKGTQGKILGTIPRFFHCACGDVFRALDLRTPLGRQFAEFSGKGLLVPDELTIELWQTTIDAQVYGKAFQPDIDALILDGIPRNSRQAQLMEGLIEVRHAFHLFCRDREKLIQRLGNRPLHDNRIDDANDAVIRRRLETYESETAPVLEFYRDKLTTIDNDASSSESDQRDHERHFESGGRPARQRSRMYGPKTFGKSGAFMSNI